MKLPAGTYFIGDPCYVIGSDDPEDDVWGRFCDELSKGKEASRYDEITEFDGHPMFAASTAYGDGCYIGSDGVDYGVDSGLIGIVPMVLCTKYDRQEMDRLGRVITIDHDFLVQAEEGIFHFDTIEIDTSDEEDDEDYRDIGGEGKWTL